MGHSVRLHNLLDIGERKEGGEIQGDCEIPFFGVCVKYFNKKHFKL